METINYQGQAVAVEKIAWMDGSLHCITPDDVTDGYRSGHDIIWRDAQGQYYLDRSLADERGQYKGVHRISLLAAAMWSIKQHSEESFAMRRDLTAALTERENVFDLDDPRLASSPLWDADGRPTGNPRESEPVRGCSAPLLQRLDLSFQLEPFHADLLRSFVGRHGVDVSALTRAVLIHHLGEIFDYGFNGGELEQSTAEGVRESGDISEELTPQRLRELCRAAGLKPENYLNAAGEYQVKLDPSTSPPPPFALDPKAEALVRRYLETTPFAYTVADIISGSVVYAMRDAFGTLELPSERVQVNSEDFNDGGWGYVEENVYDAHRRRHGLPEFDHKAGYLPDKPSLSRRAGGVQTMPRREPWPAFANVPLFHKAMPVSPDAFSLSTAAPAPVSVDELAAAQAAREREGQPTPIRDGLLHLAADWRDEGARTGGHIAAVLARCADALEAAVEGKEGR